MNKSPPLITINSIGQDIASIQINNSQTLPLREINQSIPPLAQVLPDFLEVDISDLEFYERCGNGAYGCVYRARWISRDKEVAVKKLLQLDDEVYLDFIIFIINYRVIFLCIGQRFKQIKPS